MEQKSGMSWHKLAISYVSPLSRAVLVAVVLSLLLFSLHAGLAYTFSCSLSSTCAYPSVPVLYAQSDNGSYDNAHAQNTSRVSLQGLVAWYRFDNLSTIGDNDSVVFDWSGSGNNGSFSGYGSDLSLTSSGMFRGGLRLLGKDTGQFYAPTTGSAYNYTISIWLNAASNNNFLLYLRYGGTSFYGCYAGSYRAVDGNLAIPYPGTLGSCTGNNFVNSWNNLVYVRNGTNISVYLNGVIQASNNSATGGSTANPLIELDQIFAGRNFNGTVDDLMIFNRTLSATEIQNIYTQNYPIYNTALCCSSDAGLSSACTQGAALRLYNVSNSHVQLPTYSGNLYTVPICLAGNIGRVLCTSSIGSCSAGYQCLGSIASPDSPSNNQTNSHFGECSEYNQKICCRLDNPPVIANVVLNSTFGTNLTSENLTVYFSESDVENDPMTNITDWRISGVSAAVLNMPFNTNISDIGTGSVKDYSTWSNNGTLGGGVLSNAPLWNQSGRIGGAYTFDGVNDKISISRPLGLGDASFTFTQWLRTTQTAGQVYTIGNAGSGDGYRFGISSGKVAFLIGNGAYTESTCGTSNVNDGNWHMITGVYDRVNNKFGCYVDGLFEANVSLSGSFSGMSDVAPAIGKPPCCTAFNGTLDEVQIFNKSISSTQIYEMYLAGAAGKSVQRISSNELKRGQTWTCAVTGNDLAGDGLTVLSNNLTINNSAPTVTLTSPVDASATTNRTPMFNWTGFDADGDSLTYEINLTTFIDPSTGSTSLCSDIIDTTTGSNNYFVPSRDLKCLYDNGVYYRWSVRANDGSTWGPWSSTRAINISASLAISLPNSSIAFGTLQINQRVNTTNDTPYPIVVQNDGNAFVNINLSSSALWDSVALPSQYYQFSIGNNTGQNGSFNWSGSSTGITNMSGSDTFAVSYLNYSVTRTARTDVYVQVPPNEPPAFRNSTITFKAILGET